MKCSIESTKYFQGITDNETSLETLVICEQGETVRQIMWKSWVNIDITLDIWLLLQIINKNVCVD